MLCVLIESPRCGDFNDNTQHTFMSEKLKEISLLCLVSSNYPCLEHIFMVPNVCEPLKFYYIYAQRTRWSGYKTSESQQPNLGSVHFRSFVRNQLQPNFDGWLEHLWNHENMFETGVVRANEFYS